MVQWLTHATTWSVVKYKLTLALCAMCTKQLNERPTSDIRRCRFERKALREQLLDECRNNGDGEIVIPCTSARKDGYVTPRFQSKLPVKASNEIEGIGFAVITSQAKWFSCLSFPLHENSCIIVIIRYVRACMTSKFDSSGCDRGARTTLKE